MAMARALLKNSTLRHLDLTNNRISLDCLIYLVKGIKVNSTLRILKVCFALVYICIGTYIRDILYQLESQARTFDLQSNYLLMPIDVLRPLLCTW